jgi:hypothetical protein
MTNQQQESGTPLKGGSGNVPSNPDKSNQAGQKGRDPRQERGGSKPIETEPDRAHRAGEDDSERSRVGK